MVSLTVKLTLQYKPSLTSTISGSNWIFVGFFPSATCGATTDLTMHHLSAAWRMRAIRTHALKWRVASKVLISALTENSFLDYYQLLQCRCRASISKVRVCGCSEVCGEVPVCDEVPVCGEVQQRLWLGAVDLW